MIMALFCALNIQAQSTSDTAIPKQITITDVSDYVELTDERPETLAVFYEKQFNSITKKGGTISMVTLNGQKLYYESRPVFKIVRHSAATGKDSTQIAVAELKTSKNTGRQYYGWKSIPKEDIKVLLEGTGN